MDGSGPEPSVAPLGIGARVRRIEAVVNLASGGVGADAADALERMIAERGYGVRVAHAEAKDVACAVRAAVDAAPDVVVILAGDGTASLAARLAGPHGPLIAPLPGGTMNMLPHALYGAVNWRAALARALSEGVARPVSGGEVAGRAFYVAAILGAPALWAEAREAVRARRLRLAWLRGRRALMRAFSGSLHYTLGDGVVDKTEALSLVCPLCSRSPIEDGALEAAALSPRDAFEVARLGFNAVVGDWRADPVVTTALCRDGVAWARGHIPAVLDGEPCRLQHRADFRFVPLAFRALAPAPAPAPL